MNIGKGANCTISLLHHFLAHHGFGAVNLQLHADNCSGQNKNRFMMQYLTWRVLAGLNDKIEISFMLVGHTKFAPDWCFGLLKQRFRRTKVGCLADIARVVNESSEVNHAQLVGREDGTTIVPQYDWASFFTPYFKKTAFKGIKTLHHLIFSQSGGTPGTVAIREWTDSPEKIITPLERQWAPLPNQLPPRFEPPGLSRERKLYLFNKIREYCPIACQDIVCPDPTHDLSSIASPLPAPQPNITQTSTPPQRKRQRKA